MFYKIGPVVQEGKIFKYRECTCNFHSTVKACYKGAGPNLTRKC